MSHDPTAVDLELAAKVPPEFLYHGTYPGAVQPILEKGLLRMKRHHVHMAGETGTAVIVGKRSGAPVVFQIRALEMHRDGHVFYQSANGVWLVEHVPPQYLERING